MPSSIGSSPHRGEEISGVAAARRSLLSFVEHAAQQKISSSVFVPRFIQTFNTLIAGVRQFGPTLISSGEERQLFVRGLPIALARQLFNVLAAGDPAVVGTEGQYTGSVGMMQAALLAMVRVDAGAVNVEPAPVAQPAQARERVDAAQVTNRLVAELVERRRLLASAHQVLGNRINTLVRLVTAASEGLVADLERMEIDEPVVVAPRAPPVAPVVHATQVSQVNRRRQASEAPEGAAARQAARRRVGAAVGVYCEHHRRVHQLQHRHLREGAPSPPPELGDSNNPPPPIYSRLPAPGHETVMSSAQVVVVVEEMQAGPGPRAQEAAARRAAAARRQSDNLPAYDQ